MEFTTVPTKHSLVFLLFMVAVPYAEFMKLGLYSPSDKIIILNNVNFTNEIFNKNHSIFVEFYNTYCGHCRKFAPTFKELAKDLYGWRDVLTISAIDCAEESNNGICRDYEVMGYPTLKYFGPGYQVSENNYGVKIDSLEVDAIKNTLAQLIFAENKTSSMSSWPDFRAVETANPSSLFDDLASSTKYVVLVYEPENSTLALETILYFVRQTNVSVKRIKDLELAAKYQIDGNKYKIAIVNREGSVEPYKPLHENSASYKDTIMSFLFSKHMIDESEWSPKSTTTESIENYLEDKNNHRKIIEKVKSDKHIVYQADLEMAIRSILHNEIPKASHINGEKLLALQTFLAVLKKYNPFGSSGQTLISKLFTYTLLHEQELLGEDFEKQLKKLEGELQPIYKYKNFVGCVGSRGVLRGFTCSLWQLFHFMSVQATNLDTSENSLEVLHGIHGYVKYFFGCTECSQHFQSMAVKRKIWDTPTKDEAVLWLWAAHNEVNQRLAGDATEDPEFPKIQFPLRSSCPQCYKELESSANLDDKWNKTNVLLFLKNIYNPHYISHYGLEHDEPLKAPINTLRQKRMISNVFSDMDIRMGMLLYAFCIVMLVAAFKLFIFKGGYRKRHYSHEMLGKV